MVEGEVSTSSERLVLVLIESCFGGREVIRGSCCGWLQSWLYLLREKDG